MSMKRPIVFISYAWEDDAHNRWVKEFADDLIRDGIDARLDQYDLNLGDRLPHFMEQSVSESTYVLIICTPSYKEKADKRKGGVGYEGHIITGELLSSGNERKFIPIIRKGSFETSMPVFLAQKLAVNLSENCKEYDSNYKKLIATLFGEKKKPVIGKRPSYITAPDNRAHPDSNSEPISILGIINEEVTLPKMDGSRGCALYKIPFRLSRYPSQVWRDYFLNAWQNPTKFTTMHRSKIASVVGDKIVLDGTTIEEVEQYHRDTLLLCVEEANKREKEFNRLEQERIMRERQKEQQHSERVSSIASRITF